MAQLRNGEIYIDGVFGMPVAVRRRDGRAQKARLNGVLVLETADAKRADLTPSSSDVRDPDLRARMEVEWKLGRRRWSKNTSLLNLQKQNPDVDFLPTRGEIEEAVAVLVTEHDLPARHARDLVDAVERAIEADFEDFYSTEEEE